MSDGFKRVPSIFTAEPGKTPLDAPKKKKKPFESALGKSSKVLNDTVKYSSEVAKRSLSSSVSSMQKASKAAGLPTLKFRRKSTDSEPEDSIEKKVERLFDTQDLLFERLDSEPKLSMAMKKSLATIKTTSRASARYVHKQPLMAKVVAIAAISILAGGVSYISDGKLPTQQVNEVAGVTTEQSQQDQQPTETAEPNVSKQPTFDVVTPNDQSMDNGSERETPSKDKIYSFADDIGGIRIIVTQQILPDTFKKDRDAELADFAKANYLASVIQIDDSSVYHGVNEKSGIQSFVLIKGGNLIFIQADKKVTDDAMAAYIIALK